MHICALFSCGVRVYGVPSTVACVSPVRGASTGYYNSDMVEKGERQRLQREAEERKKAELQRLLNEQRQRDEARAAGGAASAAH
jgi:hypothetical protein